MFTVEMDADLGKAILITSLDEENIYEDVSVLVYDDEVYIQQYDDDYDTNNIIIMSIDQWSDLIDSLDLPSGAYMRSKLNDR